MNLIRMHVDCDMNISTDLKCNDDENENATNSNDRIYDCIEIKKQAEKIAKLTGEPSALVRKLFRYKKLVTQL